MPGSTYPRREILKLRATVGLSPARGAKRMATEQQSSSTAREQADLIVRNGRIATQDDRRSFASAVVIKASRGGRSATASRRTKIRKK